MKALTEKNWKAVLLLSIIIPVGLLTTFKLTGIFKEPLTIAETINLPSKNWVFQRPYPDKDIDIYQWLNTTYSNSGISSTTAMEILEFDHCPLTIVPPGDFVRFGLFVDASTRTDLHIRSLEITFRNDTQPSYVWILRTSLDLTNLSLTYFKERYSIQEFGKTILTLASINSPNKVGFKAIGEWLLYDVSPEAEDHQLEVLCELTYYNGTSFKKLVQPFFLTILKSEPP